MRRFAVLVRYGMVTEPVRKPPRKMYLRFGFPPYNHTKTGMLAMALAILIYGAIIGFLGHAAMRSGDTEKVMFVVNVVLLWVSAIWLFGYPALIGPAVLAAVSILALLVIMTSTDLLNPAGAHDES